MYADRMSPWGDRRDTQRGACACKEKLLLPEIFTFRSLFRSNDKYRIAEVR